VETTVVRWSLIVIALAFCPIRAAVKASDTASPQSHTGTIAHSPDTDQTAAAESEWTDDSENASTVRPVLLADDSPSSPFAGPLSTRPNLTGNWGGVRDWLAARGATFNVSSTQFYQGVTSGGVNREFEYGGRNDYLFHWDGEKSGLWQGLFLDLHGETRYGNDINDASGTILVPPNIAMLFPLPTGTHTGLTAVKATQYLSERFVVYGGKLNMLDELVQPFGAGRGVDAFMNTGLVFPVVLDRSVPYSTLGAGFSIMDGKDAIFTLMVFDTHNTPTTSGFESSFTNGATTLSKLSIPVSPFGLPGHQGVEGTYSTGTYTSLRTIPYIDVNGLPSATFGTTRGSWSIFYFADQALYVDPNNSQRSWGMFTNIGVADNDPSPIRFSASCGLGGSSPLVSRPLDTFGIGYSYAAPSSGFLNLDPQLLPLRADQAVELYYNIAVTPWLRLTPDLQILIPGPLQTQPPDVSPIGTAVICGVRAKIVF
jgi:porin